MTDTEELTDIHIKVPVKLKKKFKAAVSLCGSKMTDEIKKLMEEFYNKVISEN